MINLKKLLTEEVASNKSKIQESADFVRSGLEKVFASGGPEISYRRVENVGLGYIHNISEAFKTAITEGRKLAKSFGYKDDEANEKFIKEDNDFGKMSAENPDHRAAQVQSHETGDEGGHYETDMNQPEEKKEVQIGKEILKLTGFGQLNIDQTQRIRELAKELLAIHGGQ